MKQIALKINNYDDRSKVIVALVNAGFVVSCDNVDCFPEMDDHYLVIGGLTEENSIVME